ncbi:MAG: hypothetical protein M1839_005474 [Geoglossum umbratile]|nr:MAG: hypothetical protein M1839_005474 [Geoglossum umbratile]
MFNQFNRSWAETEDSSSKAVTVENVEMRLDHAASAKVVPQPLRSVPTSDVSVKTNGATSAGQKRRAEEELERIMAKAPKRDGSARRPSALMDPKTAPGDLSDSTKPKTLSSSTTRPSVQTSNPSTPTSVKKPQDLPAANTPKPPPKKGSYAEILARANAAQANAPKVGIIKHKPVEGGLRKRDRLNQRREGKELAKKLVKNGPRDSKSERPPQSGKAGDRDKPIKSNTGQSTYRGTARVKPEMPSYKGTARVSNPSPTKPASRREKMDGNRSRSTSLNPRPSRYQYTSEEDEEEDYESDNSSDMEAAPFELEEEEHISLKTARKEDEEALKEETRLKKQKEEKKKMLAALAAKRR